MNIVDEIEKIKINDEIKDEKKKIKFAHLINPFKCREDNPSYLYYAQPITFKSMILARNTVKNNIDIKLYSIHYPEDDKIIPKDFIKLPYLKRSTKTLFPKISKNKKLPIIQDMFNSILEHSDADYIIFTNSDIGVQPHFYKVINNIIKSKNLESFSINRRDNLPKFRNKKQRLSPKHMDYIYKLKGKNHNGHDCFIIKRQVLEKINMGLMFTGYPPWGSILMSRLKNANNKHVIFRNLFLTFHLGSDRSWNKNKKRSPLWIKNVELSKKK